jgi:hypothetical protein
MVFFDNREFTVRLEHRQLDLPHIVYTLVCQFGLQVGDGHELLMQRSKVHPAIAYQDQDARLQGAP